MNNLANDSAKTAQSKILVLGATGGTGRLIVSQALARRHEVTALVRSPEAMASLRIGTRSRQRLRREQAARRQHRES